MEGNGRHHEVEKEIEVHRHVLGSYMSAMSVNISVH